MERIEQLSADLSAGQADIRENMITLTGVVNTLTKMEERQDRMEVKQDELRMFMWKTIGILGTIVFTIPLIVTLVASKF